MNSLTNVNKKNSCELVFTIDIKPEGRSRSINTLKISSINEIKKNGGAKNETKISVHIICILLTYLMLPTANCSLGLLSHTLGAERCADLSYKKPSLREILSKV